MDKQKSKRQAPPPLTKESRAAREKAFDEQSAIYNGASGMTAEDLEQRSMRIAASSVQNSGDMQGVPLSAITPEMSFDPEMRQALSDPNVVSIVGGEGTLENLPEARDNQAILGISPNQVPSRTPAQIARGTSNPTRPAQASPVQQASPVPQNQAGLGTLSVSTVDFLLQQNHALRAVVEELSKRLGEKPSFNDPRLKGKALDPDALEGLDSDTIKKMIQLVMVETQDGYRAHAVLINGKQVSASSFKVAVDVDTGVFDFDVNLRTNLFKD